MCRVPIDCASSGGSTAANLLEPLQCRESKVCRGLSHEFGVVRLYFTGGIGCVGYLCATSGGNRVCRVPMRYFRVVQPQRTSSNHFSEEKARCVEVFRMSSRWFDYTEPSRTASSQGE